MEQLDRKIAASAGQRKARNKNKNKVNAADFKAVIELVGDVYEGQELITLMLEMNALTEVHKSGYQGGVSRITDGLNPLPVANFGFNNSQVTGERALRPMLGLGLGVGMSPAVPAMGAGLAAAGRAIDGVTGRRSRVNRFVNQNQSNAPLPAPSIPRSESVTERTRQEELDRLALQAQADLEAQEFTERKAQEAEETRQANLYRVQEGAPPLLNAPESFFRDGTGLDRSQIAQVLRILKANSNTLPAILKAIEMYETSIATGGFVNYDLIRDINLFVDKNGAGLGIIPGPRNARAIANGNQAQAQQNLTQKEKNYERGIQANRNAAETLKNDLNNDRSVSVLDKAKIGDALNLVASSTITDLSLIHISEPTRR